VSYTIPRERISTVGEHPIASGGFGDVWEGSYGGRRVAIKALRIYKEEDMRNVKRVGCSAMAIHRLFPLSLFIRPFTRRLPCGNSCRILTSFHFLELPIPPPHFPWCRSGCRTEMYGTTSRNNRKWIVYSLYATYSFPTVFRGCLRQISSSTSVMGSKFFTPIA
jgi:hypothetical protein